MTIVDFSTKKLRTVTELDLKKFESLLIVAAHDDLENLQKFFGFDSSTIQDCLHYDENIRYSVFPTYDFISLIHFFRTPDKALMTIEVNIFISDTYCILVLPTLNGHDHVEKFKDRVLQRATGVSKYHSKDITRVFYAIFDEILTSWSLTMEDIEDDINDIESYILNHKIEKDYLTYISKIKEITYIVKKMIRPMVYIGDALVMNENNLIAAESMKYFANIDERINKLYDFSASLQEYSAQMLSLYESKIAIQTNDVVNKLTILTVFFGPPTIIVGIYGMNFHHMPELAWPWGYPFALALIGVVSLVVYFFLRKNKWF